MKNQNVKPKIMSNDPVVKRIEAVPGDVIRITRASQTAGKSMFYRVVIALTKDEVK